MYARGPASPTHNPGPLAQAVHFSPLGFPWTLGHHTHASLAGSPSSEQLQGDQRGREPVDKFLSFSPLKDCAEDQ